GALQCALLTSISGVLFVIFARQICGLMHSDPDVVAIATPVLMLAGAAQPILAIGMVYAGSLRGAGDTVYPLIYTTIGMALMRLPFGFLLGLTFGMGLFGAWLAVVGDMIIRMILVFTRFRRGKWVTLPV
ncbi:MAG: MATE family efflux transporter, partial [Planctomycetes bacterium]|nr:MATE family efflux transporter [Planctomycetota bacterium]